MRINRTFLIFQIFALVLGISAGVGLNLGTQTKTAQAFGACSYDCPGGRNCPNCTDMKSVTINGDSCPANKMVYCSGGTLQGDGRTVSGGTVSCGSLVCKANCTGNKSGYQAPSYVQVNDTDTGNGTSCSNPFWCPEQLTCHDGDTCSQASDCHQSGASCDSKNQCVCSPTCKPGEPNCSGNQNLCLNGQCDADNKCACSCLDTTSCNNTDQCFGKPCSGGKCQCSPPTTEKIRVEAKCDSGQSLSQTVELYRGATSGSCNQYYQGPATTGHDFDQIQNGCPYNAKITVSADSRFPNMQPPAQTDVGNLYGGQTYTFTFTNCAAGQTGNTGGTGSPSQCTVGDTTCSSRCTNPNGNFTSCSPGCDGGPCKPNGAGFGNNCASNSVQCCQSCGSASTPTFTPVFTLTFTPTNTPTVTPTPSSTPTNTPCASPAADIAGYVYNDVNRDGVWQYWVEPGVNDVEVLLRNGDGSDVIPKTCGVTQPPCACATPCAGGPRGTERIDTVEEAAYYKFYPVAITGGDPRSLTPFITPFVTPDPLGYYAGGLAPTTLTTGYNSNATLDKTLAFVPNPVTKVGSPTIPVPSGFPARFPDLGNGPGSAADLLSQEYVPLKTYYNYSKFSGFFEFQHIPAGEYQLVLLDNEQLQSTYSVFPRDYIFHFDFPRGMQLTSPDTHYLTVVIKGGEKIVLVPN
ncbi:MAG: hypothetical protein WCP97_04215 [bacterium]